METKFRSKAPSAPAQCHSTGNGSRSCKLQETAARAASTLRSSSKFFSLSLPRFFDEIFRKFRRRRTANQAAHRLSRPSIKATQAPVYALSCGGALAARARCGARKLSREISNFLPGGTSGYVFVHPYGWKLISGARHHRRRPSAIRQGMGPEAVSFKKPWRALPLL